MNEWQKFQTIRWWKSGTFFQDSVNQRKSLILRVQERMQLPYQQKPSIKRTCIIYIVPMKRSYVCPYCVVLRSPFHFSGFFSLDIFLWNTSHKSFSLSSVNTRHLYKVNHKNIVNFLIVIWIYFNLCTLINTSIHNKNRK